MGNERGTLGSIVIATPSLTIGGLTQLAVSPNVQHAIEAAGAVDSEYISVMATSPGFSFTTRDLTALNSCGIAGCQLTNLDAYFQQIADYGTRESGAKSLKLTAATGFLVPRTLTVSRTQRAELSFEAFAISSDGTTAPVVPAADQTMPAGSEVSRLYTIGPVVVNGTTFRAESVSVDFGLDVRTETSQGHAYPTKIYVAQRRPVITVQSPELLAVSTIGMDGVQQSGTDSVVYFRKLDKGGLRVAAATEEHISVSMDDGRISLDDLSGSEGEPMGSGFTMTPTYDGTAAILVIDTTAAIG